LLSFCQKWPKGTVVKRDDSLNCNALSTLFDPVDGKERWFIYKIKAIFLLCNTTSLPDLPEIYDLYSFLEMPSPPLWCVTWDGNPSIGEIK